MGHGSRDRDYVQTWPSLAMQLPKSAYIHQEWAAHDAGSLATLWRQLRRHKCVTACQFMMMVNHDALAPLAPKLHRAVSPEIKLYLTNMDS